jgi:5-methylcytosine-specific restriction endonuclease McrA
MVLPPGAATVVGILWVPLGLFLVAKVRRKVITPRRARTAPPAPRVRAPLPPSTRSAVWLRDGGRCRCCRISDDDCMTMYGRHLEYDHIVPWSLGGTDDLGNIQLLCPPGNRAKGVRLDWRGPCR